MLEFSKGGGDDDMDHGLPQGAKGVYNKIYEGGNNKWLRQLLKLMRRSKMVRQL